MESPLPGIQVPSPNPNGLWRIWWTLKHLSPSPSFLTFSPPQFWRLAAVSRVSRKNLWRATKWTMKKNCYPFSDWNTKSLWKGTFVDIYDIRFRRSFFIFSSVNWSTLCALEEEFFKIIFATTYCEANEEELSGIRREWIWLSLANLILK